MSASLSGSKGGQPSTTQPIAGPWLSPQVVTRNRWPNVLWLTPRPPYSAGAVAAMSGAAGAATAMSGAVGFFMPTV